jgi:cytochrome bd-type quinol oxidase subunit 2
VVARVAATVQAVLLVLVAVGGLAIAAFSIVHDSEHSSRQLSGVGEVLGGFVFVLFLCSALLIWLPTKRLDRERAAAIILVLAEVVTAALVGLAVWQTENAWALLSGGAYVVLAVVTLAATITGWPPAED